ncbi:MAG: peptide chain release factor 2 [Desulforegulaceae bacterium]|nr:peptide chain release factor 2 [Desulforegulaceae bacterium]
MSAELKQIISECDKRLNQIKECLDPASIEFRLEEIEAQISRPDFWDNPDGAAPVLKERTALKDKLDLFKNLKNSILENDELLELASEENDESVIKDIEKDLLSLEKQIHKFSLQLMLNGEDDTCSAILSINAGAGGTEAQDWSEMLFRMYLRWCESRGYKTGIIDLQPGDEAGIKSVTFSVKGDYAFGYLKTENGVHRLVRISPFNANGKRQTSFASVFVYPEIEREINIEIEEKDLRIDVFRASGAGGQHVNKTSSAVRITHIPTGIVAQCQQEKSQHRNKDICMSVIKSRLYQLEKQKQDEKLQELHDGKDDIAWGSQIRSYILHPYQMIKDHRTGQETGNSQAVLDGDLDNFIEAALFSASS